MKALQVPVFLQSHRKPHCGPVCAKMILSFYGKPFSLRRIIQNLRMVKTGIDITGLGVFFLEQGFQVVLMMYPEKAMFRNTDNAKYLPKFLSHGGKLIRRSVKMKDIEHYIKKGSPAIVNVIGGGSGHFIVVRNVSRKRMTINDPWSGSTLVDSQEILSECHDWTGGALFILPK